MSVWVLFSFLDSTQAQVETRILSPLLVVWWIGLSSPQLNEMITNQIVRKSHKAPQSKNAIPPKQ